MGGLKVPKLEITVIEEKHTLQHGCGAKKASSHMSISYSRIAQQFMHFLLYCAVQYKPAGTRLGAETAVNIAAPQ
jgi:hypothetical protein